MVRKEGGVGDQVTTNHASPQPPQMCLGTTGTTRAFETTEGLFAWGRQGQWMDGGEKEGWRMMEEACPTPPSPRLSHAPPTSYHARFEHFRDIDYKLGYNRMCLHPFQGCGAFRTIYALKTPKKSTELVWGGEGLKNKGQNRRNTHSKTYDGCFKLSVYPVCQF